MKPIKTGVLSVDKHIVFAHFAETQEADNDPAPVDLWAEFDAQR